MSASSLRNDYPVLSFSDAPLFRQWLMENARASDGIWLRIYKKDSHMPTVTYAQALDEALCYGWIDGQKNKYDEVSFLQKFTPRRSRSLWSKRNIEHVERLTNAGRMTPFGQVEVDNAKADGRWAAAYDAPSEMTIPESFLHELEKHPEALAFLDTLNKSNRYAIAWRLQTAKTEQTRQRRQEKLIDMLIQRKKLY